MQKLIDAIYEKGVIRLTGPSKETNLKEHQEIRLIIFPKEDIVSKSRGAFGVNSETLKEIAESEDLLLCMITEFRK